VERTFNIAHNIQTRSVQNRCWIAASREEGRNTATNCLQIKRN
jgi:hypothetical protein